MLQSSGCFKKFFEDFRSRGGARNLLAHGAATAGYGSDININVNALFIYSDRMGSIEFVE